MMKSDEGDAPRESGASNQSHDSSRDITSSAAPAQPAVTATDLRVTRGRKEILHGLDLNLAPGTITGLLGPSGCGKTTLMRAIVGVQRYHGQLEVLGHAPGAAAVRGRVGYVTQDQAVYRDLTARQNLRYFASLAGSRARDLDEVLDVVGLTALADRPVSTYSGGEAGRVSLACALVADPDLLVMDEPTVGLDPVTREELWTTFHTLAERGATLLVSSHVMDEAFRCDQVLLMRSGRILATTTAKDLLASTGADTVDAAFLAVIADSEKQPEGRAALMHLRTYLATTRRILTQLRADRRTVGLIAIVPAALLTLLYFVYRDYPGADLIFNHIAVSMMAILPTTVMFLVTSVAMLRERVSGTLERLWTTPIHRADLLFGYATAFALTAIIQSLILCSVAAWGLDVDISASWVWVVLTALVNAFVGVSLGLLVSAFARTEFQAVQFMPVVIAPQLFLCGLLVSRDQLPRALEVVGDALPMSWAVDAVTELTTSSEPSDDFFRYLAYLVCFGLVVLGVAASTVPRKTR